MHLPRIKHSFQCNDELCSVRMSHFEIGNCAETLTSSQNNKQHRISRTNSYQRSSAPENHAPGTFLHGFCAGNASERHFRRMVDFRHYFLLIPLLQAGHTVKYELYVRCCWWIFAHRTVVVAYCRQEILEDCTAGPRGRSGCTGDCRWKGQSMNLHHYHERSGIIGNLPTT